MKKILIALAALMMAASMTVSACAESTASSLSEAQKAYRTAKQSTALTGYEDELKAMVEAGTLTQEQADLLLTASKETAALKSGVCPSCGYQFQTVRVTGKTIKANKTSKNSAATEESALEQARDAYTAAKESSEQAAYEDELKSMVEAGSITQEQADLLLAASKEAESLANNTCPSCGYQFQTVTLTVKSVKNSSGKNGRH